MKRKLQSMDTYNTVMMQRKNGISISEISNNFNISKSTLSNWFYCNKKPIVKRPNAHKNLGEYCKAFDIYPKNISKLERAYLLGTLYSDGCSSRGFKLSVIDKDFLTVNKIIIEKIINNKIKIRKYIKTNGYKKEGSIFYEINIVRKKLKVWLEKQKLNFKNKQEILYFVSGFFDGDGCIKINNGKSSGTISLAQKNKDILIIIQKLLKKIKIKTKIYYYKTINMNYLIFHKKEYMYQIYKYGNISIKRKRDKIKFILLNGKKKYKLEKIK